MSIFIWNYQGAGSSKFLRAFKFMLNHYKPDLVVLLKTHIIGSKVNNIINKLGVTRSHRIEAIGHSGGIWLLWNMDWDIDILVNDLQFVHTCITSKEGDLFYFTPAYGSPIPSRRKTLWNKLTLLNIKSNEPWLVAGDFNAIVSKKERKEEGEVQRKGRVSLTTLYLG